MGIKNSTFPFNLKLADISPCFKTGESTKKQNFRPICVLSGLSKIYERVIYTQMFSFVKEKLSHLLCGFREKYSTHHTLTKLVEACRKCLDNKKELWKWYLWISQKLMIAYTMIC